MISSRRWATGWHALTLVVATGSLVYQLILVIRGFKAVTDVAAPGVGTGIVRFFSYFTVESNMLVAWTALTLTLRPDIDGPLWRVLRMNTIIGITVTGLVAWFILRPLQNLQGAALLADRLLHIVSPAIAVIGWTLFGPRGRVTVRVLWLSLIFPIAWLAYTLVRGARVDWYPYPFIDVIQHGYATVIVNCVVLAVGFIVLSFLVLAADRGLSRLGNTGNDSVRTPD